MSYRTDDAHRKAFSTSTITASRSSTFISSRSRASVVRISFCRSVRIPWKRFVISFLRLSHVANSFGNRLMRLNFINVSKDLSSIFSERQSTTSSALKRDPSRWYLGVNKLLTEEDGSARQSNQGERTSRPISPPF